MKNPMNPMFEEESKYEEFRATVKIWLPLLNTLDGTGFLENMEAIVSLNKIFANIDNFIEIKI
jgi:hypothetical protein